MIGEVAANWESIQPAYNNKYVYYSVTIIIINKAKVIWH